MKKIFILLFLIIIISLFLIIHFRPTKFFFIDSFNYRLGDMVIYKQGKRFLLKRIYKYYYPDSIANEYLQKVDHNKLPDYDLLYDIVEKRSQNIPKPSEKTLIIHLRIGDVIEWEYNGDIDKLLEGKSNYNGNRWAYIFI